MQGSNLRRHDGTSDAGPAVRQRPEPRASGQGHSQRDGHADGQSALADQNFQL